MKCFLVKSYCLSVYGCSLWTLNSSSLKVIETALNKLLRKLWNLPRNSHTTIVHSVAKCHSVSNLAFERFCSLYAGALSPPSDLVRIDSSKLFNHIYGCYQERIKGRSVELLHDFSPAFECKHFCPYLAQPIRLYG